MCEAISYLSAIGVSDTGLMATYKLRLTDSTNRCVCHLDKADEVPARDNPNSRITSSNVKTLALYNERKFFISVG